MMTYNDVTASNLVNLVDPDIACIELYSRAMIMQRMRTHIYAHEAAPRTGRPVTAHAPAKRARKCSLVPRPHPLRGKRGLVNLDRFLGLDGSVRARRNCCTETNLGSDWSVMLLGRGPTIQICIAGNGALHSCGWRVI